MNWNHLIDGDLGDSPMSPYYIDKEEESSIIDCPMCLGAKSFWDGIDYSICEICHGHGYVEADFELDEDYLDIDEEE